MKHKYDLIGPEAGVGGFLVTKVLYSYEGHSLVIDGNNVVIRDDENNKVAVIRLAEGQSVKQVD